MTDPDLAPIIDFLAQLLPFDQLDDDGRLDAARGIEIAYFARSSGEVPVDYTNPQLYIVRSGAFEVRNEHGELLDRLGEGDYFGFPSLLTGEAVSNRVQVLEDGLVYILKESTFRALRAASRDFDRFFNRKHAERLRHSARYLAREHLSTARIRSVMASPVQSVGPFTPVQDAAKLMRDHRISSVLVVQDNRLLGILTDRDLRNRVLAEGVPADTPVNEVMTSEPVSVPSQTLVFEAMLSMSHHNIHHLPVCDDDVPVGVVTSTDLIRAQRSDPLYLIGEIDRQQDRAALVQVAGQIPALLQSLIQADARAEEIGRVLTLVTDALTRRLLTLAEDQLGPAPMPWCWLAFGSQARMDQAGKSDQDNGMLLAREPTDSEREYFLALATFVCDGLNDSGYIHCPGGIMAMNPTWCLSLERWQAQFEKWIDQPEPKAVMHASIFFDMRPVAGRSELAKTLQRSVLARCRDNQIFLAMMAGNACKNAPPLGFFRQLVLERDGEQRKALDLKHKGLAIINDIARLYALACGSEAVGTASRIQAAMKAGLITRKDALNLADAQEFIAHLRLANQGEQWSRGESPSNYLRPGRISGLYRHQLKDAFAVVSRAQDGARLSFTRSL
ncbi:CBS domain-containing protein [Marinobacter hydrocarbonoclasticus]|nr:CBS domain-containing protein [Marinobacter nauticus]